jgi:hypothetical protein
MNFDSKSRAETSATKNSAKIHKKQFIQYEPELAEELNAKKSKNQSVSGRLLTLLYKRLSFWSRYAKHRYEGRRYFWKSISELSEELCYSTKQVARGLKSLEELGMIKREKLNKHNWKHTYYYYLPHSVHTAEQEGQDTTRSTSSYGNGRGSVGLSGGSKTAESTNPSRSPLPTHTGALQGHQEHPQRAPKRTPPVPIGTGASGGVLHQDKSLHPFQGHRSSQNVPFISKENNPLLTKQLMEIVEKCMDYGKYGKNIINGRGVGFAT